MPLDRDNYVRLAGSRWLTLRRRGALYLGPDHLLEVERSFPWEKYNQIDFRDIQAMTVRRTPAGLTMSLLLGGITLLMARNWWQYLDQSVIFGLFVALIAVVWLAWTAQGGTCVCRVSSPVQTLELSAVGTMRAARRVLPRIRTAVQQVQGSVDEETLREGAQDAYAAHQRVASVTSQSQPSAMDPHAMYAPAAHAVLMSFTVATGAIAGITWLVPDSQALPLVLLTTPVALIAGLAGSLRNRLSSPPRSLRMPIALAAIYCGSLFGLGVFVYLLTHGSDGRVVREAGLVSNLAGIVMVGGLTVGLPGLAQLARYRGGRGTV
jgi:hypothetical protein